ncbi:dynein axonemal intermediate chain 4 [Bombina bombina]|uniref:dynein axonemal intermediate chain 4 n=1 Tax=Bombina bombina TaxID=8345 RepID=UPI00235B14CC|nr:dynein axonemal intermediate chain 4 [Bombina bombina]
MNQADGVFDELGVDVTPRALFHAEPASVLTKPNKLFNPSDASGATLPDLFSISQQTGISASFVGPFTRSTFGGSTSSKSSMESFTDEIEEPVSLSLPDIQAKQIVPREPTTEDLSKIIDIYLTDTETIWLLDIQPMFIANDCEQAESVKLRNDAYSELCKNRFGNDRYTEKTMQTFNGAPKNKDVQCERIVLEDTGVMASAWDLYDSLNSNEEPELVAEKEKTIGETSTESSITGLSKGTKSVSSFGRGDSYASSLNITERSVLARIPENTEHDPEEILNSEKFQQDLFFMERILVENICQSKLAAYRQLPVFEDPDIHNEASDSSTPSLDRLWSFVCEQTKGHNVSSTSWNKKNSDLLAVGYGEFNFKEQDKGGLACCWSLKNTMWPERIFRCNYGVTALDFSSTIPNLLAVGMYNGTVAIYDVQNKDCAPLLDSSDNPHGHASPVWQLKWIMQDKPSLGEVKGEILVSISADGRIIKWNIRKGLDCIDLMKLKRTDEKISKNYNFEKEKRGEAYISRQAPGMCFDFLPKDSSVYLAGTDEGYIHKCSCSYNEQFLDTYRGHKGPIYKVVWSPFCPDVFLSCSADWCILLWRQDRLKPILCFSASKTAVHDVMWSPVCSLVFAAVNNNRVEIWDLGISTIDPVIVSFANPGVKLTTVLFTKNTNCVLVGDSDGQVNVYQMRNMTTPKESQANALYDLIGATLASQL